MKLLFTLFIVALLIAGAFLAILIWRGASARATPAPGEMWVGRTLRHFAIPQAERLRRNPIIVTTEVMRDARAHWADHCAICHANDGSGNTEIGRNLYPQSPDMRKAATQDLSDGELFAIIRDGVKLTGMPGWGGSAEDNWKLVHLVRHLPHLTPEEIDEMERLNPKSPAEYEQKRREQEFLKGH